MILLYIPFPSLRVAKRVTETLLKEKLIACGNIIPGESLYVWKGKLVDTREWTLLAKTTERNRKRSVRRIEALHPYDEPCILALNAKANDVFGSWVKESVR
jgi:periplasmic divalent cation tolerance protein